MSEIHTSVVQLSKMLGNLDNWLEKALNHAEKKKFEPSVLLEARLAPDMYPLRQQIQTACDGAKFLAARLAGKEAPKHPDTETSFEQLRARSATCASTWRALAPKTSKTPKHAWYRYRSSPARVSAPAISGIR